MSDPLADAIDGELARWRLPAQMFVSLPRRYLAEILAAMARRMIEAEGAPRAEEPSVRPDPRDGSGTETTW